MPSSFVLADIAKSAWRVAVQPAQFARRRQARYRAAGLAGPGELTNCRIDTEAMHTGSEARCRYTAELTHRHLCDYRHAGEDWTWKPWLGTAAVIPLCEQATGDAYLAQVAARTGKAFARSVGKARRLGYATSFFPPQCFEAGIAEILGSRLMRSGGLVPYALLPRRRPTDDTGLPNGHRPKSWCRRHWTLHFGVLAQPPAGGGQQRLVGFVKIRRSGTLVHALQIMGHGDHMHAGINDLMHAELIVWLIGDPDGLAAGVTHYLYGAIEHAGEGLAQWKLRRGFKPMLIAG